MLTIGLTGGIASGKTSVANWFEAKGIPVINADKTAHELMEQQAVITVLVEEFGGEYLTGGKINRALLGDKVFRDAESRRKLEKIMHPLVLQSMKEKRELLKNQKHKAVIFD
ncbi:MAG: dephospho-CoA kinase, partial [Peptococcaceae bacterium]|nr:dephospho-CoA kinase [Peptococcaceae bacterium]